MHTEDAWERIVEPVTLDAGTIAEMVRPAFPGRAVRAATLLPGGKSNTSYRLEIAGESRPYVLRLYVRDRDACRRDPLLLERVAGAVPAPRVLHHDPAGPGGHAYAITTFVEGVLLGEALRATDDPGTLARSVGRTLARIAAHEQPGPGLFGDSLDYRRAFASNAECFLDFVEWALTRGKARRRLGPELTARVRRHVDERAHLLAATEGRYHLVHGDYKIANLLAAPGPRGWAVSGVLDWEFAFGGTPLFDAAILLRHEPELPAGFAGHFAEGFTEGGGALPPGWRAISRLLDLANLLGFLNGSAHRERLFGDVRRLLVATLERPG